MKLRDEFRGRIGPKSSRRSISLLSRRAGWLQRPAIAPARVREPGVLPAAEPTGNLDSASAAQVMALLQKISSQRRTAMVVVTHGEEVARQTARRIRLRDGKIPDHHP